MTRQITFSASPSEQKLLQSLLEGLQKKITKKYKQKIQDDWYDLDELGIRDKLAEHDADFGNAQSLIEKIF